MNLTQIYALFKTKTFIYLFLFETNVQKKHENIYIIVFENVRNISNTMYDFLKMDEHFET